MNDKYLLEFVQNYSVVYDLLHPKYMGSSLKQNIFDKLEDEINCRRYSLFRTDVIATSRISLTRNGHGTHALRMFVTP